MQWSGADKAGYEVKAGEVAMAAMAAMAAIGLGIQGRDAIQDAIDALIGARQGPVVRDSTATQPLPGCDATATSDGGEEQFSRRQKKIT